MRMLSTLFQNLWCRLCLSLFDGLQTWCPPCKQIKPVYHDLSNQIDNVAFGLVDVDDNGDAAVEFQISAVPTFIFSDGEKTLERFSGADPNQLNQHLKNLSGQ